MQKRFITITFIFCLLVFLIGCVATLKDYKPKSSVEEAIKIVLVSYENAWNKHNEAEVLAFFHDSAKVMYGSPRSPKIASKKEYVDILPERIAANPAIELSAPKINIKEDKAVVKVNMSTRGHQIQVTFNMVQENNRWFIMGFKY